MRHITVYLHDESLCQFDNAEAILDVSEGVLIVHGDDGEHITFNWAYVAFYISLPMEDTGE